MARYGFKDLVIEFDSAGLVLQNISQYVLEIGGIKKAAMFEESHAAGDSWVEQLFAGLKKVEPLTIKGFYDDAALPAPDVLFNDIGNEATTGGGTRTLKLTYGGTKTTSVETFIQDYSRLPVRGELTKFEVTLLPSGAPTET